MRIKEGQQRRMAWWARDAIAPFTPHESASALINHKSITSQSGSMLKSLATAGFIQLLWQNVP